MKWTKNETIFICFVRYEKFKAKDEWGQTIECNRLPNDDSIEKLNRRFFSSLI